ncbi:tricorn protease-like protein [Streptomyces sp. BK208]|uniref:S41 family peptidase n=1 Tax=Streptomyces sp. BK208 TaxID=2512150 RepID=UPI0010D9173E|nr:S41 family peptidase [Streptomyces sp. BK208]TDT29351.1 tricorn protease-like protein [Streptomyces sp. BK208]
MRTVVAAGAVALALALTAPTALAQPAAPRTDGVWRTDGYGTVVVLDGDTLQEYQTTAVGCLKGDAARRTAPGRYTGADGDVITVRVAGDGHHASLSVDGSVGHRALRRLPLLPGACTRPLPQDPVTTFDVFWQSFEDNYPFFAAKGVDWHAVRQQYRPHVRPDTTREQLFDLFSSMVRPLHDAHVAVRDGERAYAEVRPGTEAPGAGLDARARELITTRDLRDAPYRREFAQGRITYADLAGPGRLGYLRVSGFGGYTGDDPSYTAQLRELDAALDTVFTVDRAHRLRGLIIDLRVNGGGSDALGVHLAGRLTDTPYTAYAKRVRNDPHDPARRTAPEPVPVLPSPAPRFTGPVAVLTGGSTFSAGETFTQALMARPGRTLRIGQATQGLFSDVMHRYLPNGMNAWLPNEEFLDAAGRTYDGTGIPPHLVEPVFTAQEFAEGRDSAFDRAVNALCRR